MNKKETASTQADHLPYRVRLPGFVMDEEIGLGEVVKRVSSTLGIRACGGCARRATALNRWVVFGGRAK